MADAITFARTDEQNMLASTVREFLAATVDYDAVRTMSTTDNAFDAATWQGLAEMGLIGLHVPDQFGGAGFTAIEAGIVFEELGHTLTAVPLLSCVMASTAILAAANDEQKARFLPWIASGEKVATLAVFEESHDNDPTSSATSLTQQDGSFTLSGTKRYVTDGPNASLFLVSASTPDGGALVLVDSDSDGVEVIPTHALDPTRPLAEVRFDHVSIVAADVMQGAGSGIRTAIDMGVACLANEQVGGAQWCLETSVEYAKTRFQFGRAIGSFQAVKHLCADMLVAVEHARSVARHAAASFDDPAESAIAVPLARSVCSDAFVTAAGDTIQILGGIGFTWEHEAHLYLKRAKSASILLGSVYAYRDRLADAVGI
ncbi:MAG: acyl-CoA/acyl-ACP dehydrogenase [Acidimicrobiia bacterium]|nr:acyl-CoA/acyl-ACP dehydrogenase [Acidimicrobiia bacterium]